VTETTDRIAAGAAATMPIRITTTEKFRSIIPNTAGEDREEAGADPEKAKIRIRSGSLNDYLDSFHNYFSLDCYITQFIKLKQKYF
jgi:hypothetical protein